MIPLLVSPYSFRGSTLRIDEIVSRIKDLGLKSILLADTNFHFAVIFNETMRKNGVVPVHGLIVGSKVLVARNREGFEDLVKFHNGVKRKLKGVVLKDLSDFKIVMYLNREDRESYVAMKRILGLEPLKGDFSFEGNFEEAADIFKAQPYDLKVKQEFKDPTKDWIDLDSIEENLRSRVERELEVIERLGFKGYFHAVERVVKTAERLGIEIGPGRGSAVGSALLHVLGVVKINPLEYGLLFERFLNEGRKEPPDVDIDVEDVRRKELIKFLKGEFSFVSLVSTFVTLKEKLLEREISRLNLRASIAEKLRDLPIRRSIHAAAVVLSDSTLNIPLVKDEIPISEYDMESLKAVGVEKLDVLGLRTLTFLKELSRRTGKDPKDFGYDEKTFKSISSGLNTGVFQLESKEARRISRYVAPKSILELSHLLALNRPGPLKANLHLEYLKRRISKSYEVHRDLEDILDETKGIFLYQEQIMLAMAKLADISLEEADDIRRAISKKDESIMDEFLKRIRKRMLERYDESFVEETISLVRSFSSYAFNKSHSVAYAHVSYWLSYFKENYFPDFLLTFSSMNAERKIFRLVCEAFLKGFDVKISVSNPSGGFSNGTIYLPLRIVPGVNEKMEREIGSHRSRKISDLSNIPLSTLHDLVKVGAFDEIYGSRIRALKVLRKGERVEVFEKLKKRFGEFQKEEREETEIDWISMEFDVLGFSLTRLNFESKLPRLCESIAKMMELPSHVKAMGGFISDGLCTLKVRNLDDGEYLVVVSGDGEILDSVPYEDNVEVVYDLEDLPPSDSIIEDGEDFEKVIGAGLKFNKKRPLIDSKIEFRKM